MLEWRLLTPDALSQTAPTTWLLRITFQLKNLSTGAISIRCVEYLFLAAEHACCGCSAPSGRHYRDAGFRRRMDIREGSPTPGLKYVFWMALLLRGA